MWKMDNADIIWIIVVKIDKKSILIVLFFEYKYIKCDR